ncbi:MAG: hypothetical protein V2I65_11070 [Paracoccaceae bacterium]|jgi:hypothetical protein|nr:hypothetical protein [Paracoccaceae bacterium]
MKPGLTSIAGLSALGILAACVETGPSGGTTGGVVAPPGMVDTCVRQIRAGNPTASVTTRAPILAGPDRRVFIPMTVDGAAWGCRTKTDGRYTAFPEFAH